MAEEEFIISYETLFELLRRERDREELQKLKDPFFEEVKGYVNSNKKMLSDQITLASFEDKKKIENELNSLKKILKELYEKREKKIMNMALDKSRIKTNIVDTASMLSYEKELFDSLVMLLNKRRDSILSNIFAETEEKKETNETTADFKSADEVKKEENNKEENKETKLVRFMHAVPKFVGKELEEYGPFEEEDVASLPTDIAQLLIDKARAEEINAK